MRNLVVAAGLAMALVLPVAASDHADVMASVRRWADAFGRGTFGTDRAPCADDAVIIDDFQPYVWQGPGACSRWFEAFEAWAANAGAANAAITLGKIRHLDIEGGHAYLVAPVTLSYTKAAKPVRFPGTLIMTLRKADSGWLVSGMAWEDQ